MPIFKPYLLILVILTGFFCETDLVAQENPPFPIEVEVRNAQFLNFGAFTVGPSGGTVSVSYTGSRNSTGDIQLLNMGSSGVSYALFDIYANPGTILQIQQPLEVKLMGPAGSNVTLSIDPDREIENGRIFVTNQNPHEVYVGGTLTIPSGDAGPAGNYNGSFTLTFIHQ